MAQEASYAPVALLVNRAVRRDVAAFEALYDRFIDRIYRYFLYRVGDSHKAEDLTSAVFLKAWQSIDKYQQRGVPFGAWLYKIAHNTAVDYSRSLRAETPLEDQILYLPSSDNVENALEMRLSQAQLRHALGLIGKDQRQVILLHFFEGLTYPEIAEVLGKREGAIRTIQYRALKALRRVLDGINLQ